MSEDDVFDIILRYRNKHQHRAQRQYYVPIIIHVGLCLTLSEINDFNWEYFEIRNRYKKSLNDSCLIFFFRFEPNFLFCWLSRIHITINTNVPQIPMSNEILISFKYLIDKVSLSIKKTLVNIILRMISQCAFNSLWIVSILINCCHDDS